jgi:uncharacterized protein (UPF0264 family)
MTAVLASVRGAMEAERAIAGGVDWIDLKEPAHGALGAVARPVILAAVRVVAGRLPVSATIGDLWQTPDLIPRRVAQLADTGVDYLKIGLYASDLEPGLIAALDEATRIGPPIIAVCFAESPPTSDDLRQMADLGVVGVMLDTADKAGPGLTGLMTLAAIAEFVATARGCVGMVGLAGRLRRDDIGSLVPLRAHYLGFRSALCAAGRRQDSLDIDAVTDICAAVRLAERGSATTVASEGRHISL